MNIRWDEPATWMAAVASVAGPIVAGLSLSDARRKGREARDEKSRMDRAAIAKEATDGFDRFTTRLMEDRVYQDAQLKDLQGRVNTLEEQIRKLTGMVSSRDENIAAKDVEISRLKLQVEHLQGENRLLRQTLESKARFGSKPVDPDSLAVRKFGDALISPARDESDPAILPAVNVAYD